MLKRTDFNRITNALSRACAAAIAEDVGQGKGVKIINATVDISPLSDGNQETGRMYSIHISAQVTEVPE